MPPAFFAPLRHAHYSPSSEDCPLSLAFFRRSCYHTPYARYRHEAFEEGSRWAEYRDATTFFTRATICRHARAHRQKGEQKAAVARRRVRAACRVIAPAHVECRAAHTAATAPLSCRLLHAEDDEYAVTSTCRLLRRSLLCCLMRHGHHIFSFFS